MDIDLPETGFIFWPVGAGDSTTIIVNSDTVMQVDLHHMAKSDDEDEPSYPVVDWLVDMLPIRDDRPYLSTFALTHPDEDHIKGFGELLKSVEIGELWFTPRIFREFKKDLCDDAVAFKEEAERRLALVVANNGDISSGDRLRIIGYDELLEEDEFNGFPDHLLTVPGNDVFELDGEDVSANFSSFIHAPFKGDAESERNDSSLAIQVTLLSDSGSTNALLFGDLKYDSVRKIIDQSQENGNLGKLNWNVLLAPHHCSKSLMYVKDEDSGEYVFQQDIMDDLESLALEPGYIISSSTPIPATNKQGDNPPHALAKEQYELIAPTGFICTHENPVEDTNPVVLEVTSDGLSPIDDSSIKSAGLAAAIDEARGQSEPPTVKAGFG